MQLLDLNVHLLSNPQHHQIGERGDGHEVQERRQDAVRGLVHVSLRIPAQRRAIVV